MQYELEGLLGNLEINKPLRRPRHRQENNMKIDL
jgi:hypothetical protein